MVPIKRKSPKEIRPAVCDVPIVVCPVSADEMGKIERRFPFDFDAGLRPENVAFHAAIMARACFEQAGTTDEPKPGAQAWTETDLRGWDGAYFWDLWANVGDYLSLRAEKAAEDTEKKGSPSASAGPSGSPASSDSQTPTP